MGQKSRVDAPDYLPDRREQTFGPGRFISFEGGGHPSQNGKEKRKKKRFEENVPKPYGENSASTSN